MLKVEIILIPLAYILEKIQKDYDRKQFFGYHDPLKIYGAPRLSMYCYVLKLLFLVPKSYFPNQAAKRSLVDHVTDKGVANPKYRITSTAGPRPHVIFIHLFLWMKNGLKSILNSDNKDF